MKEDFVKDMLIYFNYMDLPYHIKVYAQAGDDKELHRVLDVAYKNYLIVMVDNNLKVSTIDGDEIDFGSEFHWKLCDEFIRITSNDGKKEVIIA